MSIVRIPPTLRTATGGAKELQIDGATVREALDDLVAAHPSLAAQLLDANGDLNRFINVFVNDTDIRYLEALETPLDARDRLVLLPAMAGG